MDTTIRNLRREAYVAVRSRAVLKGVNVGEPISDAIEHYLALPEYGGKKQSIKDLPVLRFGPGSERLSEALDSVLYSTE